MGLLVRTLVALLACAALPAFGQGVSNKPVKVVLPYTAGGAVDFLARTTGERLSARLGQPVVVESRPGAYERIATEYLLREPADGHTILLVAIPHATNPTLFASLPYDTQKDFQPLIHLVNVPPVLVVNPESGPRTLSDLVKLAAAKPGSVTVGSPGTATSNHLLVELLGELTGTQITHIPFKGDAPSIVEVLGGRITGSVDTVPAVMQHLKAGRLRGVAIASRERIAMLPDIPTFVEQGVDAVVTTWFGYVLHGRTPRDVTARLNTEINAVLQLPEIRERLVNAGMTPVGGSTEQFGTHIRNETARWARLIKARGVRVD
jgi:tripartite-type tricarboxylate transporter receptor subunit TctC